LPAHLIAREIPASGTTEFRGGYRLSGSIRELPAQDPTGRPAKGKKPEQQAKPKPRELVLSLRLRDAAGQSIGEAHPAPRG